MRRDFAVGRREVVRYGTALPHPHPPRYTPAPALGNAVRKPTVHCAARTDRRAALLLTNPDLLQLSNEQGSHAHLALPKTTGAEDATTRRRADVEFRLALGERVEGAFMQVRCETIGSGRPPSSSLAPYWAPCRGRWLMAPNWAPVVLTGLHGRPRRRRSVSKPGVHHMGQSVRWLVAVQSAVDLGQDRISADELVRSRWNRARAGARVEVRV